MSRANPFRLRFFAVMLAMAGAGCMSYQPQLLSPERNAAAFQSRELTNPELRKFAEENLHRRIAWPPRSWDLALLSQAALFFHPDLDVARAKLSTSRAAILTAGASPNPTLGWTPQYTTNDPTSLSPWTLGFTLDIPIETAGKRGLRVAQARELANAAALNVATTAWQVQSRLRKTLLDFFAASQHEELLVRQEGAQQETVGLLEQRIAAGEISRPEVLQSRLLFNQNRLLAREAQKQRAEARAALADAAGVATRALDGVNIVFNNFERLPRGIPERTLRGRALRSRSDVLGSLAEYAASEAALRLEIAKQYPDLHLGPGYQWDQGFERWSVGISLALPLLDRNRGPIAEALAKRTEAAANFNALQAHAIGQMDAAFASYRGALQKLTTADELLAAQQKQQRSTESLFKAGESDRLALTSAEVELDATELSRLDALIEAQQSLSLLEDALQTTLTNE